ncbi:MAG: element excision factor XisI family protein [Chloroflexi bacterium]|nr:element excision factor XisI family protein [Chloroflexota bacterium]
MDSLREYRPLIERLLADYMEFFGEDDQVETVGIIDQSATNYLLLELGWQHPQRIYNVIFHVRLHNGRIHVEQDWTREGIAHQLLEAGVPQDLLVLGYQDPDIQSLTTAVAV